MKQIRYTIHKSDKLKLDYFFFPDFKVDSVIAIWSDPIFIGIGASIKESKHYFERASDKHVGQSVTKIYRF